MTFPYFSLAFVLCLAPVLVSTFTLPAAEPVPETRFGASNSSSYISLHPELQTKNCPSCCMPDTLSCTRCTFDWDQMASAEGMIFPDGTHMTRVVTEDMSTSMVKFTSLVDSSLNAYIARKELSPGVYDYQGTVHGLDNRVFWLDSCYGGHGVVWIENDIQSIIESEENGRNKTEETRRMLSEEAALLDRFGGCGRDSKLLARGKADKTTIVTFSVNFHVTKPFEASVGDVDAYIDVIIAETNDGYINSGVPLRVAKHCIKSSDIEEEDDYGAMITKFGKSAPVSELRDSADIAFLLVKKMSGCGVAYSNLKGYPIGVATQGCAKGYYSFGHEIAHMFGASHNREEKPKERCPYCYGFLIKTDEDPSVSSGYRSIMSYAAPNHRIRVNYYSSSTVRFIRNGQNVPLGNVCNDNARILREHRFDQASIGDESAKCVRRDGQWSSWSEWECDVGSSQACGTAPNEVRTRTCTNPYPMNNGKECQGGDFKQERSAAGNCDARIIPCPVCKDHRSYCFVYETECAEDFAKKLCPATCGVC